MGIAPLRRRQIRRMAPSLRGMAP